MTDALRHALNAARVEAQRLGVAYVGTEHLLLGVLSGEDASTLRILASAGVSSRELREEVELHAEHGSSPSSESSFPYTSRGTAVFERMIDEMKRLRASHADTAHLLLGLAAEGQGVAAQAMSAHGLSLERLRALTSAELGP